MSKPKTTAKTTTTAATKTAKKTNWSLSTIRGNFDGLAKKVSSLPESREKTSILNAIEEAYVDVAGFFKGIVAAPTAGA